jgi:hypothetical protein
VWLELALLFGASTNASAHVHLLYETSHSLFMTGRQQHGQQQGRTGEYSEISSNNNMGLGSSSSSSSSGSSGRGANAPPRHHVHDYALLKQILRRLLRTSPGSWW